MRNYRSIIYVNFAQYENVGRILDFLREEFPIVIQFSYDHLRLKRGGPSTLLRVFENGKLVKETKLLRLSVPEILRFPSVPIVAILMLAQTIWHTYLLKKKYKKFEFYLTLDAFSAWVGNFIRELGLVRKTIFWVGDYFPLEYPEWRIRLLRRLYWQFDKPSMQNADRLIFTNRRLINFYSKMGNLLRTRSYSVVPIGTNPKASMRKTRRNVIGFLGMIKNSQGLELIFDILPSILKENKGIRLEIAGSGPEEYYFRKKARKYGKKVIFHGFVQKQDEIENIVGKWKIGLAPYKPVISNESYWGDPSKIKVYLSVGVPVITTDVSYMAREIAKNKAGIIIDYYNRTEFLSAIREILKEQSQFQKRGYSLARKYDYNKTYRKIFLNL